MRYSMTTRGPAAGPPKRTGPKRVLPSTLTDKQLREILGYRISTYFHYKRQGQYKPFELPHPIGSYLYSGRLVARFLYGDHEPEGV